MKEFDILEIQDVIPKDRGRRIVKVIVEVRDESGTKTLELGYPAHGADHYSASIDYYNKLEGKLNHTLAGAISLEVKRRWYDCKGA